MEILRCVAASLALTQPSTNDAAILAGSGPRAFRPPVARLFALACCSTAFCKSMAPLAPPGWRSIRAIWAMTCRATTNRAWGVMTFRAVSTSLSAFRLRVRPANQPSMNFPVSCAETNGLSVRPVFQIAMRARRLDCGERPPSKVARVSYPGAV